MADGLDENHTDTESRATTPLLKLAVVDFQGFHFDSYDLKHFRRHVSPYYRPAGQSSPSAASMKTKSNGIYREMNYIHDN